VNTSNCRCRRCVGLCHFLLPACRAPRRDVESSMRVGGILTKPMRCISRQPIESVFGAPITSALRGTCFCAAQRRSADRFSIFARVSFPVVDWLRGKTSAWFHASASCVSPVVIRRRRNENSPPFGSFPRRRTDLQQNPTGSVSADFLRRLLVCPRANSISDTRRFVFFPNHDTKIHGDHVSGGILGRATRFLSSTTEGRRHAR